MSIKLIIKGNPAQAVRAAHDRGISLNRLGSNSEGTETYARCASDYQLLVAIWFNEPPYEAPFEPGSIAALARQLSPKRR